MNTPHPIIQIITGTLTAFAVALLCIYSQAFIWATSAGVRIGLDLDFRITHLFPATWPYTIGAGLLFGVIFWHSTTNKRVARNRIGIKSALLAAIIVFILAFSIEASLGDVYVLANQTGFSKASFFLSTSVPYIAFIFLLCALLATPQKNMPPQPVS